MTKIEETFLNPLVGKAYIVMEYLKVRAEEVQVDDIGLLTPRVESARFQLLESTSLSSHWYRIEYLSLPVRHYMEGGTLLDFIIEQSAVGSYSEENARLVCRQLLVGLAHHDTRSVPVPAMYTLALYCVPASPQPTADWSR